MAQSPISIGYINLGPLWGLCPLMGGANYDISRGRLLMQPLAVLVHLHELPGEQQKRWTARDLRGLTRVSFDGIHAVFAVVPRDGRGETADPPNARQAT